MRAAILSLAGLLLLGACATEGEPRSARAAARNDQCFNASTVRGFRPVGRDAVDVTISRNRVYRLGLSAGCLDVDWAQRVALRSRTGSFICGPLDAELIVPSFARGGADRCQVVSVRRLSEAEIVASRATRR